MLHLLLIRRGQRLTGVHNALQARPFAGGRPAHADADLCRIQIELRERAAQSVAMHAELFGGPALITLVMRENFEDVAPLELLDGIRVRDPGAVHPRYDSVQFALQGHLTCGRSSLLLCLSSSDTLL